MFAQASATSVAPSRIVALPVSVRRNELSGVSRLRAHAVRPEKRVASPASICARDAARSGRQRDRGLGSCDAEAEALLQIELNRLGIVARVPDRQVLARLEEEVPATGAHHDRTVD